MAKSKKLELKPIKLKMEDDAAPTGTKYAIKEASIKDDFCNYTFEITEGVGQGASHKVVGPGIVKEELIDAFRNLIVHMAVIDDGFQHERFKDTDISALANDEIVASYMVNQFKIKGAGDAESIQLIGNKYVNSVRGRMEVKTPFIELDNLSSYKWHNELKAAADEARLQVSRYNDGYYTPVKQSDETDSDSENQGNLFKDASFSASVVTEDEFKDAKV